MGFAIESGDTTRKKDSPGFILQTGSVILY